ncbi:hypothetical protein Tco_0643417 [Tanacetum coccineum]
MYHTDNDASISGMEWDLETWMDDDDVLQQEDLVDWQQDPYHGDDEAEETTKLFAELDQLLEHVAFLNDELRETGSVGKGRACVRRLKNQGRGKEITKMRVHMNVSFGRPNKRRMLNSTEKAMEEKAMKDYGLDFMLLVTYGKGKTNTKRTKSEHENEKRTKNLRPKANPSFMDQLGPT